MRKKHVIIILVLIAVIGGIFLYTKLNNSQKHFQVTFFDIGQGDAALIQFNDGKKMLVDCGADRKILAKLGRALPFYDRAIDYVLATHPDLDHYGGCVDVLKNYKVKEIIINGRKKENDPYWRVWDKAIKDEGAIVKILNSPQVWTIASSSLEFFSPDSSLDLDVAAADSNNYSIVFKLENKGLSYLFTGDMEEPLEKVLAHKYCSSIAGVQNIEPLQQTQSNTVAGDQNIEPLPQTRTNTVGAQYFVPSDVCPALQSDILKVGHHGSDSSSGEDFLNLVNPKQAIISVGKNKYGHPSLRVMKKLERAGAEILRTDEAGDIVRY